jgi:uncharacterized protein YdeI (BOF family)
VLSVVVIRRFLSSLPILLLTFAFVGCGAKSVLLDEDEASASDSNTANSNVSGSDTDAPPDGCGDGIIQGRLGEVCDGENLVGATCCSIGQGSGTLRCNSRCKFDSSLCVSGTASGDVWVFGDGGLRPFGDGGFNPPLAEDQSVLTLEDRSVEITLEGSDIDGDELSFAIESRPKHGTLRGSGNEWIYDPDDDFNGDDAFTFTVSDGTSQSADATVSIRVRPVNDPPTAEPQSVTVEEGSAVEITLSGSDIDGDSLRYRILSGPENGILRGSGANWTYTPNRDFNGTDGFSFSVSDGFTNSDEATVSIDGNTASTPILKAQVCEQGMTVDNVWAQQTCSPMRASTLTGLFGNKTNVGFANDDLTPHQITMARQLRDNGYSTGMFGKWHLGEVNSSSRPCNVGFEIFKGNLAGAIPNGLHHEYRKAV